MELHYYRDPAGNFGDDLNPWLWPRLFPKPLDACFDDETLFIGIGSLLNHRVPARPEKKVVFGTGCGYGPTPPTTDRWRFYCVRGPLTAEMLRLPASAAISDGAILVRQVMETSPSSEHRVAFMPHHTTAPYDDWRSVCESLSICYVDPTAPVEGTLETIRNSGLLIAESLHGAIIADAFRVPWIPVRTRPRILELKWLDWSRSLKLEHAFEWLPPAWKKDIDTAFKRRVRPLSTALARERLRWLARFGKRRLSREDVFEDVLARMRDAFARLVDDAA